MVEGKNYFTELLSTENALIALILILIAIAAGLITGAVVYRVTKKIAKRNLKSGLYAIIDELKISFYLVFIILAVIILMPFLNLGPPLDRYINHTISIFIIVAIAFLAIRIVGVSRILVLLQYDIKATDNLEARKVYTQLRVLERIVTVAIIIIAVGVVLMTFERIRQVGVSLLASAGIAGIILGFAAQKSIATILAGFQIALTQPIRIDDVVVVENEFGWVEEITLTYVVVRVWDKRRLIIPITYFIDKTFQNWTRVSADILGTVFIYTDYNIPFEKLRIAFLDILNKTDLWDKQVGVMQVTDSKEKSVEIRLLMSAPNAPRAWDLRVHVREKIIKYLQENHSEHLPQYRVQLIKESTN